MVEPETTTTDPTPAEPTARKDLRHVYLWNNVVSLVGLFLVAVGVILILTFVLFSVVTPTQNPYVGIVGYLILPTILIAGLIITPVGILLKYWRIRRRDPTRQVPVRLRIDFDDPRQLRFAIRFAAVSVFVMLPVVGVSGYHGYHYTDSTEFCAKVCHSVMEPQGTTFEFSPHAKVSCAECHIGSGAGWFVKSKLSGTRQVLAVWQNTFPRPIPPGITELRPARETCGECHWPAKFFGSQLKTLVRYSPDESNTRREVRMLLKTGGADESIGRVEGIHMHMAIENQITEYVATDDLLQEIPWVRYTDEGGEALIYRSDGNSPDDPRPDGMLRTMDCMDCHNRAAHLFRSPQQAIDLYLNSGRIDATLPYIKREAVAALALVYADGAQADEKIKESIERFYRENYPQLWETRQDSIRQSAEMIRDAYGKNFFPEMNVTWKVYPDNIGHLESSGCFRCHDGKHFNQYGEAISSDCEVCHTFLNPVMDAPGATVEGAFQHSMSLVGHESLSCTQCHTGGPLPLCRDCHQSEDWLLNRGKGRFIKDDKNPH